MWDPGGPPERSRHRRAAAAACHHSQVMLKGRPLSSVRLRRDVIVLTTSQTLEKLSFYAPTTELFTLSMTIWKKLILLEFWFLHQVIT